MRKSLLLLLVLLVLLAGCGEKAPQTEPTTPTQGTTGPQEPTVPAVQAHPLTESTGGAVETTWDVFWYHKQKFGQPNEEARTKERNMEWRVPTITGTGAGVFLTANQEEPDFAEHKEFSSFSAAKAFLNTLAGISTTT